MTPSDSEAGAVCFILEWADITYEVAVGYLCSMGNLGTGNKVDGVGTLAIFIVGARIAYTLGEVIKLIGQGCTPS